ncbi:oligopeptide ABC transporter [Cutibacterium acnes JCM 18918]|nr:oligopeptide ABC transporter [Cutibacterium acnes JCM 18918]
MKKPRKRLLVVTAAVAATLLVASCSYGSGDPSRSQASGGAQDGNVSFATTTPNWILPVSAPGKTQGENAMFTQLIYPALFSYKLDAKNEFNIDERHSVAKPPTVSDDSLTYTITLKDRTWSDGVKLTTRDMEFWWNIVTNNTDKWASYRKGQFPDNVKAFKIIDDKAFTITTTEKYNPAWFINNQLNRLVPMPAHAWSKTSDSDKPGEKDRTPAGAKAIFKYLSAASEDLQNYDTNKLWKTTLGPFQLGKYTPNGKAKLVASPSYDGEDKASISSFTMQPYTSDDAEFNILRSGSIDYGFIPPNSMTQQKYIEKQATPSNRGTAGRSPTCRLTSTTRSPARYSPKKIYPSGDATPH